ncbi:hypothetical protein [Pontibacter ummariensis]|nr:hypothetical protein [Pontibacter ummariensis]
MNKKSIKSAIFSLAATMMIGLGLVSCNKGTEPGETNVGRGEIYEDEGSMVVPDDEGYETRYEDTANLEKYYDHTDHENHEDNSNKSLGDGAYDGEGTGVERDEIDQR